MKKKKKRKQFFVDAHQKFTRGDTMQKIYDRIWACMYTDDEQTKSRKSLNCGTASQC